MFSCYFEGPFFTHLTVPLLLLSCLTWGFLVECFIHLIVDSLFFRYFVLLFCCLRASLHHVTLKQKDGMMMMLLSFSRSPPAAACPPSPFHPLSSPVPPFTPQFTRTLTHTVSHALFNGNACFACHSVIFISSSSQGTGIMVMMQHQHQTVSWFPHLCCRCLKLMLLSLCLLLVHRHSACFPAFDMRNEWNEKEKMRNTCLYIIIAIKKDPFLMMPAGVWMCEWDAGHEQFCCGSSRSEHEDMWERSSGEKVFFLSTFRNSTPYKMRWLSERYVKWQMDLRMKTKEAEREGKHHMNHGKKGEGGWDGTTDQQEEGEDLSETVTRNLQQQLAISERQTPCSMFTSKSHKPGKIQADDDSGRNRVSQQISPVKVTSGFRVDACFKYQSQWHQQQQQQKKSWLLPLLLLHPVDRQNCETDEEVKWNEEAIGRQAELEGKGWPLVQIGGHHLTMTGGRKSPATDGCDFKPYFAGESFFLMMLEKRKASHSWKSKPGRVRKSHLVPANHGKRDWKK